MAAALQTHEEDDVAKEKTAVKYGKDITAQEAEGVMQPLMGKQGGQKTGQDGEEETGGQIGQARIVNGVERNGGQGYQQGQELFLPLIENHAEKFIGADGADHHHYPQKGL